MRISIELVPRSADALVDDCRAIQQHFPSVNTINVPDLLRFDLRSWHGCACARQFYATTIPHIRAIDIDLDRPLAIGPFLVDNGICDVLVVAGDPPTDMSRTVFPTSSLDAIRKIRAELPGINVYAALDPYRSGFREELEYAQRKLDAGAAGLFTQPFFDRRLMEIYRDLVPDTEIFWGVTPVMTERSRRYWETRNHAVFPADFRPALDWNRSFARTALDFARESSASIYFMPIKIDLVEYLQGLL